MAEPADDEAAMAARRAALRSALGTPPGKSEGGKPASSTGQAMNLGARVLSEFVAAVAVGGFIGWQIDKLAGTSPFGLIVFIGLGTAAGFWTVYRVAAKPGSK